MTAALIVALWVAASVPVALLIAAIVRTTRGSELAEEVELYLRGLGARHRGLRRPVTIAVLCVAMTGLGLVVAAPIAHVSDRVYTVASRTPERFGRGPGPRPPATQAPVTPALAGGAAPDAEAAPGRIGDATQPAVTEEAPVVTAGGPGGPSDASGWRGWDASADDVESAGDEDDTDGEAASDEHDDEGTDHDDAARASDDEPDGDDGDDATTEDDAGDEPRTSGDEADDPEDDDEEPIEPAPGDLDGDGIADDEDDDVDGDGIPNDDDDDVDGDGIPNDDDDDVDGDGSADSQEARREGTASSD